MGKETSVLSAIEFREKRTQQWVAVHNEARKLAEEGKLSKIEIMNLLGNKYPSVPAFNIGKFVDHTLAK